MADMRAQAERIAATGGHRITWEGTFTDSFYSTPYRAQDGWCDQGRRAHCHAAISTKDATITWRSGQPSDPCPGLINSVRSTTSQ